MIRVRGGKAAAIPWIERGFPGKPLELKIKVEPRTGLLFAHSAVVPAGDFDYVRDVAGVELGKSRTSISAERIRSDLNAEFGSPRFRHGPQALYDQKLSNDPKEKERVVAFTPDGDTYAFETPVSEGATVMQYRDLLIALRPEKKDVFRQ